ncbi:integral membrane protein [Aspergillus bombycis]|uniref:Integral membrane protein n=1 Tax=Aspergillus bombycis TaxID=109264 RepID=A0A1F7ZQG0_9EURO|nr:integral membrane protein [Aspergillus bombycis]OGM41657.1 integral membrane protein [Aspergillus bombycis]
MVASCTIFVSSAGTSAFLPVISEMRNPKDYKKPLYFCMALITASYLTFSLVVYRWCGKWVASPSLGSAGQTIKMVSYGVALVGLIVSATLYLHVAAKYVFVRILGNSRHLQANTVVHWGTWISSTVILGALSFILAEAIPIFNYLIALNGAMKDKAVFLLHCGLVLLGIFFLVGATYGVVVQIIDAYSSGTIEPVIPPPPGITSNFAHPTDVLHTVNLATQLLCIIVVTVAVALRIIMKLRLRKKLEWEDYTAVAGCILFVGFCVNMLVLNAYGGGYHGWDVPKSDFVEFQKASYAITIIYVPMAYVVKLALLSILLRIFAPDHRKVLVIRISLIVLLLYYIPALFIKVFFCKPISAYWYGTNDGGTCMDQRKVIIADSAISIASDLWILILPVPLLWSLHMSTFKKLRVIGILSAGGIATAFSVWRLVIMVKDAPTTDITWAWVHVVLTANAEAAIGLICACLPSLSAYVISVKDKNSNANSGSYLRSHELGNWKKTFASRNHNHTNSFQTQQNDQTHLISIAGCAEAPEGSLTSLHSQRKNHSDRLGIRKEVTVSQSYEFVR